MEASQRQIQFRCKHRQFTRRLMVALCALTVFSIAIQNLAAADPTDPHGNDAFAAEDTSILTSTDYTDPEAAAFDQWESIVEPESQMHWDHHDLKPIDWLRHFGFRHSSSHGRHVGKGLPLKGSSVLNRPFHFDWFAGPLLGDDLIDGEVKQGNVNLSGIRLGWDYDYYWGVEWRFGWAEPTVNYSTPVDGPTNYLDYTISDIDLIYYPWGDSKVRPYALVGIGGARLEFMDASGTLYDTTLATMPFGGGLQFRQASWLMWRLEVLDNLSFGDDRVATLHNVSLTAGMEIRLGARPRSYWPWRSSRKIW